jgi:hypothetical protein
MEIKGRTENSLLINSLPMEGEELEVLTEILVGKNEISHLVLYPHNQAGKPVKLIMMVKNLPGKDGENRLPVVEKWVKEVLSPAMPAGWGADLTEPIIFYSSRPKIGPVYFFFISPVVVLPGLKILTPTEEVLVLKGEN